MVKQSKIGDGKRFILAKAVWACSIGREGLQMLRMVDMSSLRALRESLNLSRKILKVRAASYLDVPRLKQLHRLVQDVDREGVDGDFVECGVYRGGSAALLGHVLRHSRVPRHLWLFDSFQGLPRPTDADGPSAPVLEGDVIGNEQKVRRLLDSVDAPLDRIHIVAGWFHETFPRAQVNRVAFLHLDVDWYESYKLCLERFYDLLVPGSVVVLDDYYDWPGCKTAFEDFVHARSLRIELTKNGDLSPYFRKPT